MGTLNANSIRNRMTMGAKSTNPMVITATIKLETKMGKSRFELELEFKENPAPEIAPNTTLAIEASPV
jgi:hypothetical protein